MLNLFFYFQLVRSTFAWAWTENLWGRSSNDFVNLSNYTVESSSWYSFWRHTFISGGSSPICFICLQTELYRVWGKGMWLNIRIFRETIFSTLLANRTCYVNVLKGFWQYLSSRNKDFSIFGGTKVVHDSHQMQSFCTSFLCLRHMQVHFVTIKICIIRATYTFIEAQCPA